MRYYEMFRYADNIVGGEFIYCTESDLETIQEDFSPDKVYEITKNEYDKLVEKEHRKHLRISTGYPKI